MKIYFDIKGNFKNGNPVYFDYISIEMNDEAYSIELVGDFDYSTAKDHYSGRFKGSAYDNDIEIKNEDFINKYLAKTDKIEFGINDGDDDYQITSYNVLFRCGNSEYMLTK